VKIDFDQIRELLSVVGQTNITELTIESGDEKITVKKAPPGGAASIELPLQPGANLPAGAAPAAQLPAEPPRAAEQPTASEAARSNGLVPITSPMVGTFYRAPSPSAPPFVDVGDVVNVGQTVCIIEAMKLMNDLPSEVSGRIVKICVENGTTVEYGQPLFMVDPTG
jgi:acetyl-CoA carboxylase biotin carboxyl carrier protein